MNIRVGVDIGGTFTDAIALNGSEVIATSKALTTRGRLSEGVLASVRGLGVSPESISTFVHGTTAGLNAFLEKRGSRVALITTKGFRDVYEIGRASRPDMYNLSYRSTKPLVPRSHVFELNERLSADGTTLLPVDEREVRDLAEQLKGQFDAVAVVLLHSYKNAEHEVQVQQLLHDLLPEILVVSSHVIAPEWREYERTSTTAISAYIAPIIDEYLTELGERLQTEGITTELRVMQSNGGIMSALAARTKPVQTLFSGPVGGTIAGAEIGKTLGDNRLICVDMGGTSFDVSLVIDAKANVEAQVELEGHPVLAPSVKMHTIGAGGGSVAHVVAGAMRVGPRSAGSQPGPACYGRGGTEPTVTDANVFLGRLPHSSRLGGSLQLDVESSKVALEGLGQELKLSAEQTATGVITIVNAAMANAIREITITQGIDPRDFTLVAFGGAGPLHAMEIAEELQLQKVIIPRNPGVLSAWGMLQADTRHDLVTNFYSNLKDVVADDLAQAITELSERGRTMLKQEGVEDGNIKLQPAADLRYVGQEYTVTVEWPISLSASETLEKLPHMFESEHERRYGHSNPGEEMELVNLRMAAIGLSDLNSGTSTESVLDTYEKEVAKAYFANEWQDTVIVHRLSLTADEDVVGPAVIVEADCTTAVPPSWRGRLVAGGHLLFQKNEGAS